MLKLRSGLTRSPIGFCSLRAVTVWAFELLILRLGLSTRSTVVRLNWLGLVLRPFGDKGEKRGCGEWLIVSFIVGVGLRERESYIPAGLFPVGETPPACSLITSACFLRPCLGESSFYAS